MIEFSAVPAAMGTERKGDVARAVTSTACCICRGRYRRERCAARAACDVSWLAGALSMSA